MAEIAHMRGLLEEMRDLSSVRCAGRGGGPDRCEGVRNDVWHGMQMVRAYATGKETPQMRLREIWYQMDLATRKGELKKLAAKVQHDFLGMCLTVNKETMESIAGPNTESNLDAFIDACTFEDVQELFELMLVQWGWRTHMQEIWKQML
jgi:hypothetical protein